MTIADNRHAGQQLKDLLAGKPPVPSRSRFQPLRLGLIGIWEYSEQEFHFHDGRLILRGRNGSGKTKVLEVTSPFLLDADLTARRLDPFGTAARSMRDNLLFGDHTHRIGYVWCEYGRTSESGAPEYLTIGAGMRAQRSRSGAPESWYFATSQRPGEDFSLLDAERSPHNQARLTELIGTESVFGTATAYRTVVSERLFGTTPERFRSLVELLIALRRPKLSENFGIEKLTSMLTHALPPVDEGLVDELARGFDELAIDQDDLERIEAGSKAIDTFLVAYRDYARHVVQRLATRVRGSVTAYDDVTRQKTAAERELADAIAFQEGLYRQRTELDLRSTEQSARIRALEQRPEIEQRAVLLQLERQAGIAERAAAAAQNSLTEAAEELDRVKRELQAAEELLTEEEVLSEANQVDALDLADRSGLRLEHEMQSDRLWVDAGAVHRAIGAVVNARRSAIARVRVLRAAVSDAQLAADKAESARDDAIARRARTSAQVLGRRSDLDGHVEAVTHALLSWVDDCREIRVDPPAAAGLIDLVQTAGEPGARSARAAVFALASAPERTLLATQADLDGTITAIRSELRSIRVEHERVEAWQDEPPPPPAVLRRDRAQRIPGAPLWKLVEFAADLPENDRVGIEAALLGAGLLDAWVTPDGTALAPDTLDVVVRPGAQAAGENLATVLTAAADGTVSVEVVTALLESVGLREDGDAGPLETWVSRSGSWSIGPLRGRTTATTACYIGASAREAARLRRLAELARQRASAEAKLAEMHQEYEETGRRILRLDQERQSLPDDRDVRDARARLDNALEQAAAAETEAQEAEQRWNIRRDEARAVQLELNTYAEQQQIDPAEAALARLEAALSDYREAVAAQVTQVQHVLGLRSTTASIRSRHDRQRASHARHEDEAQQAREFAVEARTEYLTRHELHGADVDDVLREVETARQSLSVTHAETRQLRDAVSRTARRVGAAESDLVRVETERTRHEEERSAAVTDFDRLRAHGFLALIEMRGVGEAKTTLTRTIDEARRAAHLLREIDVSDKAQNTARNAVDQRFRELQQMVGSADWRPWGANDGTLFLARVTYNGVDHDMIRMQEILADEIETRRTLLDDRERELFGKVLVGKVGEHLRACRREALELVDRMNVLLLARPTASGLQMDLKWETDPEAGDDAARALSLLDSQAPRYLAPETRTELIDFLAGRVESVRAKNAPSDWKSRLRDALDYRNWCRFRIRVRKSGGQWRDLTDGMHQQGSGGEKAVMLQLPLFVAAAAHYQALGSTAPHPVYLDEAFAGIDAEMRGSCMGLLADLDLDFVMASHDEWGFHEEVPGVTTYELFRDPRHEGVLATPFVWDGKRDHRLSDPLAVPADDDNR